MVCQVENKLCVAFKTKNNFALGIVMLPKILDFIASVLKGDIGT